MLGKVMVFKTQNSDIELRALVIGSFFHDGLQDRVCIGKTPYDNTVKLTSREIESFEDIHNYVKIKEDTQNYKIEIPFNLTSTEKEEVKQKILSRIKRLNSLLDINSDFI